MQLHDVRDVEAHVRVALDSRLGEWGATLDPVRYDEALTFLLEKCWELAGLTADGKPRLGIRVRAFTDVEEIDDGDQVDELGWFADFDRAFARADRYAEQNPGAIVELEEDVPPPGAYDASLGLSFSTYSRRILAARVVDWYRSTFGDSRYGGRRRVVSLDAIAERYDAVGEAPEQFLDTILTSAVDPMEEVLDRVALGG